MNLRAQSPRYTSDRLTAAQDSIPVLDYNTVSFLNYYNYIFAIVMLNRTLFKKNILSMVTKLEIVKTVHRKRFWKWNDACHFAFVGHAKVCLGASDVWSVVCCGGIPVGFEWYKKGQERKWYLHLIRFHKAKVNNAGYVWKRNFK